MPSMRPSPIDTLDSSFIKKRGKREYLLGKIFFVGAVKERIESPHRGRFTRDPETKKILPCLAGREPCL